MSESGSESHPSKKRKNSKVDIGQVFHWARDSNMRLSEEKLSLYLSLSSSSSLLSTFNDRPVGGWKRSVSWFPDTVTGRWRQTQDPCLDLQTLVPSLGWKIGQWSRSFPSSPGWKMVSGSAWKVAAKPRPMSRHPDLPLPRLKDRSVVQVLHRPSGRMVSERSGRVS